MNSAIGIVIAIENVPHGESASALTTTSASTASRMIMIENTAISAATPPTGPISSRAIWPRLLPSRRIEKNRVDHVLHGAGEDDADDDPDRARQVAHLRGEHGADERAGAGDRGEVVAEQDPPVGRLEVHVVVQALGRGGPRVVDTQHLAGDEAGVEAVRDRVRAHSGGDQPGGRDLLAADERDDAPGDRADDGDRRPDDDRPGARLGLTAPPLYGSSTDPDPLLARSVKRFERGRSSAYG